MYRHQCTGFLFDVQVEEIAYQSQFNQVVGLDVFQMINHHDGLVSYVKRVTPL